MGRFCAVFIYSFVCFLHVSAHSNLGKPLPYNPLSCKASVWWCKGACPPIWKTGSSRFRNTPNDPPGHWKRGQVVEIIWHKNNHIGGFYRRSLVPLKHMYSHKWHEKLAFDYGCWSQGEFICGRNKVCGGDKKKRAYRNYVRVPAIFPDGIYVFAQVWFGGIHWEANYPQFPDYFSCAYVRIQGGTAVENSFEPTFSGKEKKCRTGATRPLQCGGTECRNGKVGYAVPDAFFPNGKPRKKIYKPDLNANELATKKNEPFTKRCLSPANINYLIEFEAKKHGLNGAGECMRRTGRTRLLKFYGCLQGKYEQKTCDQCITKEIIWEQNAACIAIAKRDTTQNGAGEPKNGCLWTSAIDDTINYEIKRASKNVADCIKWKGIPRLLQEFGCERYLWGGKVVRHHCSWCMKTAAIIDMIDQCKK